MKDTPPINFDAVANIKMLKPSKTSLAAFILAFAVIMLSGFQTAADPLIPIIIAVVIWSFVFKSWFKEYAEWQHKKRQAILKFATDNKFDYSPAILPLDKGAVGTLFHHGHSKKSSNHIAGKLNGLPFDLFDYEYATGSGKHTRYYHLEVMQIKLKRNLPHIVIDSKLQDVLPISFKTSQRVDLEGDFSKYFSTYAPDKHGITLLAIIAPDVMETLMKIAAKCDIEIVDDNLYVYYLRSEHSLGDYQAIFTTAQEVLREIQTKLNDANILTYDTKSKINAELSYSSKRLRQSFWRLSHSALFSLFLLALAVMATISMLMESILQSGIFEDLWYIVLLTAVFGPLLAVIIWAVRKLKLEYDYDKRSK